MKFLTLALFALSLTAHAGFEALNQGTSLNIFNRINCSTGINCTRVKDKLTVSTAGGLETHVAIATATTVTLAQCGSTFINSVAAVVTLPTATSAIGCEYTFITGINQNFDIDPATNTNQILVQTNAGGDMVRNAATGSTISLRAISTTEWAPTSVVGTWSDAN